MTIKISLSNGGFALIDNDDEEAVAGRLWSRKRVGNTVYAVTRVGSRRIYMHRRVMGAGKGQLVDHANMDGLDNRRCNLRFCTQSDNAANRGLMSTNKSGFKGVRYLPNIDRYEARIKVDGKQKHLGTWYAPEHAAGAYDEAAVMAFGEFARLNFGGAA